MALASGTRLGPYEIVGPIGAGGMGEVYRARDPRLGRDVAIKVLPAAFTADPGRVTRFEREARVLAALTHPHIGSIFGFEHEGDVRGLVLELVEGPTLAELLKGGALPIEEALRIGRQIADGLDAAHERGIIHRDLKPANVKVAAKGVVKVLDFGLAKVEEDEEAPDLSQSPTVTVGATRQGVILGTAAYMSPEQARGKSLDKRTDIWSFGCVLYEMLTGRQVFAGETASDTIAAIIERQPDLSALPAATPPAVRKLLQRCLEKDSGQRLRDIGDARHELDQALTDLRAGREGESAVTAPAVAPGSRRGLRLAAVTLAAFAAVAAGVFLLRQVRSSSTPVTLGPPVQLTNFTDAALAPALSADGRMLTFIRGGNLAGSAARGQIYVKMLPKGEPVQLTKDVFNKEQPVFSPDGSRIVYTAVNGFKWDSWQVPVLGGAPQPFLPNASGLVWADDQQLLYSEVMSGAHMGIVTSTENRTGSRAIYFPPTQGGMAHRSMRSPDGRSLLIVEMEGGDWLPCRLMPWDGTSSGRSVGPPDGQCTTTAWSPDGRWMYFSSNAGGSGYHVWRQRYPDGAPEQITFGPTEQEGTAITPDGRSLITSMGLQQANIRLQGPDGERELTSEGFAMLPTMMPSGDRMFFLMRTGARGYASGELWSMNIATGDKERALPGSVMANYSISQDGRRVVFTSAGSQADGVWIADLDRRTPPRQLTRGGEYRAFFGAPGEIIYLRQGDTRHLYRMNEDGSNARMIVPEPIIQVFAVSPDGEWAAVLVPDTGVGGGTNAEFVSLRGGGSIPVCCSTGFGPNRVQAPMYNWSIDGKWMFVSLQYFGQNTAKTVVLPYRSGMKFNQLWPRGFDSEEAAAANPGARIINDGNAFPAAPPSSHLSWRRTTQSNLYQVPLPN